MRKIYLVAIAIITATLLMFQSCNKSENFQGIAKSKDNFHSVLRANMNNVGSVPTGNNSKNPSGEFQTIYLDFPEMTPEIQAKIDQVNSIRSISDLIVSEGAILEFTNFGKNTKVQFDIPVREAEKSLDPMIVEAKKYLYSKGFSEQELQTMIATEEATEYDLIPLVIFLQETEFSQNENPFFPCAAVVIGANAPISAPSKTAIKQTFSVSVAESSGAVASAIAVGNYTQCLYKEMDVLAEAMITSDEFEKMLEKQESFIDMLSVENYLETQELADLLNVTTKAELMTWIEHNIAYTLFTSVAQASSLFDALENQIIATKTKFISPRVQNDFVLFEERVILVEEKLTNSKASDHVWLMVGCRVASIGLRYLGPKGMVASAVVSLTCRIMGLM
ncbi:MAG: hypothetical protein LBH22_07830 [Bacteroidales bacterium]|jgi:hypothetical protein|nr:hypothetical protein [Bacteroidales bacterium]